MSVTSDLSMFGYLERDKAIKLLQAMNDGLEGLDFNSGVEIMFNNESGCVFLTDSDFNVFMYHAGTEKVERFYSCPECGKEGFADEVREYGDECCLEHLKQWLGDSDDEMEDSDVCDE